MIVNIRNSAYDTYITFYFLFNDKMTVRIFHDKLVVIHNLPMLIT